MYESKSDQLMAVHVVGPEAILCLVNFDVSFPWCCWIQPFIPMCWIGCFSG